MLEKEAFDKHINSIRSRYNRLCNPRDADSPLVTSFTPQQIDKPLERSIMPRQYDFITPVRASKQSEFEDKMSFSTLPEAETSSAINIEALTAKYDKYKRESSQYSSRNPSYPSSRQASAKKGNNHESFLDRQQQVLKRVQ